HRPVLTTGRPPRPCPRAHRPPTVPHRRALRMSTYDLIVRHADIATAADRFRADIGIVGGRIVALAERLGEDAGEVLDAAGRLVTPGGAVAPCPLDQSMRDGSRVADDFFTGTRSAACGGTTTVIPFACQQKGHSLEAAVTDYHARAEGKAVIDYAFHLI